jgi:serine/threonine protein kinase
MRAGLTIQDRYELRELLGRGGMAEVWLAHDRRLDRPVAVKFLARRLGEDADALVRFFSEAQSVARIQHPGVVTVLDFGTFEDHPFLVMYYMPGGSLADVLGAPLPVERALPVVERVADAAGAAHKLGIVHRDIKPANILIDEDGNPRLADFGIALSAGAEHLTASGTAVGSPHYVSPEQAQGTPTTPRSDVYALGVVLYELLSGRKPFSGRLVAIVAAHLEETPAPPSTYAGGLSGEVDTLVMRCLAKDPNDRFADGAELADTIRALGVAGRRETGSTGPLPGLTSIPAVADSDEIDTAPLGPTADGPPLVPTERRRRVAAGALAVVLVMAVALGLAFFGGGGESDPARGTEDKPHPRMGDGTSPDSTQVESSPVAPTETQADPSDENGSDGSVGQDSGDGSNEGPSDEIEETEISPSPSLPSTPDPSPSDVESP